MTGVWNEKTVTWNSQPSTSSTILDFAEIKNVVSAGVRYITPKLFNVTKLMHKWYAGNNLGICLKMHDESARADASFVSADHPVQNEITTEMYPSCIVYYRDAKGLEDYYSYHEQSVGRAGSCYVNDFNGNLVVVHPDAATRGNRFPVSLSHVYNAADKDSWRRMGYGWRLSAQKELRNSGIQEFPYVYTDEDGTNHYFYKDTEDGNKLKDEDGLGLVITQESSADDNLYRIIETKGKEQMVFHKDGYLTKEIDPNGNTITYTYENDIYGVYLSKITDPGQASFTLNYADDGRLESIEDDAGRLIKYTYDQYDLKSIVYPDNKESRYGYGNGSNTHLLMYVKAPDTYQMYYEYGDVCGIKRVVRMQESKGSQNGQEVKITYKEGNMTVFEEPGLDGILEGTEAARKDNRVYTYQFDTNGRPVCICDQDGNASSYGYYKEGQKNNRLSRMGSTMKPIRNYLKNTRFEEYLAGWNIYSADASQVQRVSGVGYIGDKSVKVTRTSQSAGASGVSQQAVLTPGTYTASAYMKVSSISGGRMCINVLGSKADGTLTDLNSSAGITAATDQNIDHGWQRDSVTFTVTDEYASVWIIGGIFDASGTGWMTCFQLEDGEVANPFNLMENGSFERVKDGSSKEPDTFTSILTNTTSGTDGLNGSEHKYGQKSLHVYGEPDKRKGFWKRIPLTGESTDVFSVSGWAKGKGVPGKEFGMTVGFEYEEKDENGQYKTKYENIPFNPHVEDWQFVSQTITPAEPAENNVKKYRAILFHLFYGNNANDAYFDGIQIIRDDGESYVYDDEGNLISAKTASESAGFSCDKRGNLTKMSDITGTSFEYGYDEKQNLKRAASSEQVVYQFEHDFTGNPIQTRAYGERRHGAVICGRSYYIREKVSGKYLEVPGNSQTAGTAVKLASFQGENRQKWRVTDAGAGYVQLQPVHDLTKALDVAGGSNKDNQTVDIVVRDEKADAQKFKLLPQWRGEYQIAAKCSKDKRVLTNAVDSTAEGAAVTIWGANDTYNRQKWYFEPADLYTISDEPEDGSIFSIRARHSGQYLDVPGGASSSGTALQQYYYNGSDGQSFLLKKADTGGNYYLSPMCAPDMALTRIANDTQINRPAIILRPFSSGNTAQKFQFKKVGNGYAVWNAASNEGMGIRGNSWESGARVVTDGSQEIQNYSPNKLFILENRGKRIESSMTYTSEKRQIRTVTDARGMQTTNDYGANNRLLTSTRDAKGTVTNYTYDAYNKIVRHKDVPRQTVYEYDYDLIGRMTAMEQKKTGSGESLQKLRISYDDKNRVEAVVSKVGGSIKKTGYIYGNVSGGEKPGLIYGMRIDGLAKSALSYDQMSRVTRKVINPGSSKSYNITYTYVPGAKSWQTTTFPESITNGNSTLKYTYDAVGNIEKIYENGILKASYVYDGLNRLTRENNKWLNKTICCSYDIGGNITAKKEYAYTTGTLGSVQKTIPYVYGNSQWKDQLTNYNGTAITYDAMGNPLTYRDGMTMQWEQGRRLTHLYKDKLYYFAYDSHGRRVEKHVVNGHDVEKLLKYYWNGDNMIAPQNGSDLMHFIYDQDGQLFSVDLNGTPYYYIYNLQGDVIGLIDSNGSQVVSYQYDTWGNQISMTDSTSTGIGSKNPFRYRGYCYEEETGLYYLKSRFYDPVTGRFVSADDAGVTTYIFGLQLSTFLFYNTL